MTRAVWFCLGFKNGGFGYGWMCYDSIFVWWWACVCQICVVVIALVWIFGFQMNGDFWVSNERWLDRGLHFTDPGWCQNGFWYEFVLLC